METEKELSVRIHYDWLNKCRTCLFWGGDRAGVSDGLCKNAQAELSGSQVDTDCGCGFWDSYDIGTAMEVLDGKWDSAMNPNAVNRNI